MTTALPGYTTREVARLLGLTEAQVRSWVRAGFIAPRRGPRNVYRFSFQDLVLLRSAKGLLASGVGVRRVRRALKTLRRRLPTGRPLSGVHLRVEAGEIVVRDGGGLWEPVSGQGIFDFGVTELAREAAAMTERVAKEAKERAEELGIDEWFALGCELDASAPDEAQDAYERVLALDPSHAGANLNLGRLFHETGRLKDAEVAYRRVLEVRPNDATAAFNLGVALEDQGRDREAIVAYRRALELDAGNADAHYNLAGLEAKAGRKASALWHLKAYKKLVEHP